MLKAAIFDLNGIFVQAPKLSERFERDFGVPVAAFVPKLSEIMDATRKPGAKGIWSYWEPAFKEWGVKLSEAEFLDYWFGAEKVSERMVSFAKGLRSKGIKVFVLSNNFKERAEYYGRYPWMREAIDKVYFSYQTGFIKPDPKAWLAIASEQGLEPEECVYFDDQEKNIKAAASAGIRSFAFTTEEELEGVISGILLP